MEKKKLLLVAVSVGLFLVIAVGAAYLIFSPARRFSDTAESRFVPVREPVYPGADLSPEGDLAAGDEPPASMDAVDMIRNPNGIQGLLPYPGSPGIQQENNIYINNNGNQNQMTTVSRTAADGSRVLINVPRPSTAAVPDASPAGRAAAAPAPAAAAPAAPSPEKKPAPAATPKPAAPAAAAKPASSPAAPAPVRLYDTYWIQTGSFSVKTRAEVVKERLAVQGIASIIENRDINGKTFFRVRVGPYTSQNEADYWLALVKSIEGFEDSQVWQNKSRL